MEGDIGDNGEGDIGDNGEGDIGDNGEGDIGDNVEGDIGDNVEGDIGDNGEGDNGEGDTSGGVVSEENASQSSHGTSDWGGMTLITDAHNTDACAHTHTHTSHTHTRLTHTHTHTHTHTDTHTHTHAHRHTDTHTHTLPPLLIGGMTEAHTLTLTPHYRHSSPSHMCGHDGREGLQFVHLDEVLERARGEEERLSLLQWHGGGELRLLVIVSEMSNLIESTGRVGGEGVCVCVCVCTCVRDSLVAEFRSTEEEACSEYTHTGCHGNSVKILDTDLGHLWQSHREHDSLHSWREVREGEGEREGGGGRGWSLPLRPPSQERP